jgi:hypothetical protein
MSRSYTSSPPCASMACSGTALLYFTKYYYGDQIKEDEMGVTCSTHMEKTRNSYKMFVGKAEGKRPLVRRKCRWDDKIKVDFK